MDGVSFPWTALVLAGRSAVAAVQGRYSNIGFPNIHFYIGTFSNWTNGRLRKIFLAKLVWNTLKYSQNHLFSWPLSVLGLVEFQLFSSIAIWVKTHKFAFPEGCILANLILCILAHLIKFDLLHTVALWIKEFLAEVINSSVPNSRVPWSRLWANSFHNWCAESDMGMVW